ncbi:MAG: aldo/keto reductase [Ignavibacteriaceae bacterium]|nr:aldo/keto reductase [Ignavibacteriaceae bacterium]
MNFREFGKTGLKVSEVGFGGWTIGGPAMAGDIPIGWGKVNDDESMEALYSAYYNGINFYDTADFYGLGHSEELIGKAFKGKSDRVVIATKVGHRIDSEQKIYLDYSKDYIISACEESLRRLQRDYIDIYQLHSARMPHLKQGDCIEAMEQLKQEGKIRYWGISLNTFLPEEEADFFITNKIGHSFQVVLNIINQISLDKVIPAARENGYGIIARMPYQFGLLSGRFSPSQTFEKDDHRSFRLKPDVLKMALSILDETWKRTGVNTIEEKAKLAISFVLSVQGVSVAIPGIRTRAQAEKNSDPVLPLDEKTIEIIRGMYPGQLSKIVEEFRKNL